MISELPSIHKGWALSELLKAAPLPRAAYYFELKKPDKDLKNQGLMDLIRSIFYENKGRYGFKRIAAELRNRGHRVNHKKVLRMMSNMGLRAVRPKQKYHSYMGEVGRVADNVVSRDFEAAGPNEKWTTGVPQFNCPFGKCYLSLTVGMGAGDVVAWDLSMSPNLEQTKRMLDEAFAKYPSLEGLVFHSDQGWQYRHNYYQQRLREKGIVQSMSRKGNCIDNRVMESFFGVMKNGMFYGHESDSGRSSNSRRRWANTSITTTTKGSGPKQNGCPLRNSGRHPCQPCDRIQPTNI